MPVQTVAVAMSGGVDSSVAAALLKQQGYTLMGVMLRLWSEPGSDDSNRCCSPDSLSQARRVAAKLEIPFHVIDARDAFQEAVVQRFVDGYARGETPNPCLACNRRIRWGFLLEHAVALGADAIATGHYARRQVLPSGRIELRRAADRTKDQSYVLHVLDQLRLAQSLFPVGDFTKPRIREIAEEFGLPTARRKDSQDLCFLAGGDYRAFLRRNASTLGGPGAMVTMNGEVVGEHLGLWNYTVGQRKGLGDGLPVALYVVRKDFAANRLVVGGADERGSLELTVHNVNWVSGESPAGPARAQVKTRYSAQDAPAVVTPLTDGRACVQFDEPQRDVTAGQAAVFYDDEVVLGGGIID